MDPVTAQLILAFIGLIIQHGIPAAISIYNTWNSGISGEPTIEDVAKLKLMKPPEDYFKEG